jgi:hypothetical protein
MRDVMEEVADAMPLVSTSTSNVLYTSPKVGTQSYNLAQLRNG